MRRGSHGWRPNTRLDNTGQFSHPVSAAVGAILVPENYLTLKDVAELLKLSEKTIYRLAQQGEIPAFKVGGSWRFRASDIQQWVAKQIEDQKPAKG